MQKNLKEKIRHEAWSKRYEGMKPLENLDDIDLADHAIIANKPDWFWFIANQWELINPKTGNFFTKSKSRLDASVTYALSGDLLDIAEYLWEKGARVRYYLNDELLLAARQNKPEKLKLVIKMGAKIRYKKHFSELQKYSDRDINAILATFPEICPSGCSFSPDPPNASTR